jgi:hypothetical protein
MITNDIFLQAKRQRIETNEENLCYICNIPYSVREYRQCKICLRFYHLSCYNSNDYCKYCLSCEEITNINGDNNNNTVQIKEYKIQHMLTFNINSSSQNLSLEKFLLKLNISFITDKRYQFQNYLISSGLNEEIRKMFLNNILNFGLCENYPDNFNNWKECLNQCSVSSENLMIYYEYVMYFIKNDWNNDFLFFNLNKNDIKYHIVFIEKIKDLIKSCKLSYTIKEIYFKYKEDFLKFPFSSSITLKEKYNGIDNINIIITLISNLCHCCYTKGFLDLYSHIKSKELFKMIHIEKIDKTVCPIENPLNICNQLFESSDQNISVNYFYKCIFYFYSIIYKYFLNIN